MRSLVFILALVSIVFAEKWAVLLTGSQSYYNYGQQADNAHAYHILIRNGYKPENVIVFSYNDAPFDERNPFPGTLYNRPGNDSINYYENFVIDYEGDAVTPENYIKVLTGDESAGGKVLKSTEEDTIFLAYFDHGSVKLIDFPNGELYRDELEAAFATMKEKKMYKKIVYYMAACYSGSMFLNLKEDSGIYALTSANGVEPSYAYYCEDCDVRGVTLWTCLGDEFSVKWMENVDEGNLTQTFDEHAAYITSLIDLSHVSQYGDETFRDEPISEVFEGDLPHNKTKIVHTPVKGTRSDIYYNKLNFLKRRMSALNTLETKREYEEELALIHHIDTYFNDLVHKMSNIKSNNMNNTTNDDLTCYRAAIKRAHKLFGRPDYLIKYFVTLDSLCEQYSNLSSFM